MLPIKIERVKTIKKPFGSKMKTNKEIPKTTGISVNINANDDKKLPNIWVSLVKSLTISEECVFKWYFISLKITFLKILNDTFCVVLFKKIPSK